MSAPTVASSPRLITPCRDQLILSPLDVEKLIPDDHPARAIWNFVGNLDLKSYCEKILSVEGAAGRPAYDPRLLISLWVFAYTRGVGSSREIERLCGYHPAFQWLTGMEVISQHTLSNFRIDHQDELDELFTQILGVLSAENLITLKQVTQDGMKVRAFAGADSFRREETVRAHLDEARELVKAMGDPGKDTPPGNKREKRAKERAAEEREKRLKQALDEFEKVRAAKKTEEDRKNARVSETDPDARVMKHGDGGFAPSYNVQLSTDAENDIVMNVDISQSASDAGELTGNMAKVEERSGARPEQVLADGGFTTRANILSMAEKKIDFIGSLPDKTGVGEKQYERRGIAKEFRNEAFRHDERTDTFTCPMGAELHRVGKGREEIGLTLYTYRADADFCAACTRRTECCPGENAHGRSLARQVEDPAIIAFREKMDTEEAKKTYRMRGRTGEFPQAWIKEKLGLRKFRTRGKEKVKQEALWACLTYNIQQWIRLIWRPAMAAGAG